jgi:hypothetical protein
MKTNAIYARGVSGMRTKKRQRNQRRPPRHWALRALEVFGVALALTCIIAAFGFIALEAYSHFHPK